MARKKIGVPVSDEAKAAIRARNAKRRIWIYGGIFLGFYGAYLWQPWEYDFVPRTPPNPNPVVDPDRAHLFAKGTRIMVVTAHPDDSEFYIGGTLWLLRNSAEVHQVICTDGDKAYYGIFTNADENRRVRQEEATAAHKAWNGKGIQFLHHPDGRLRANDELIDQLADAMRREKPEYVLCFDGEFPPRLSHQDHRRAGDAALAAAKRSGVPKWCLLFSTIAPNFVVDITDVWDDKKALMANHRSQWTGEKLERVTNLVASYAEEDGDKFGIGMGEGFRCFRIHE